MTWSLFMGVVACGGLEIEEGTGGDDSTTSTAPPPSSGGTEGGTGGGDGTTPTATYLAYRGSVYIVDPANPFPPIQISPKPILDSGVLKGLSNYDGFTQTFSDLYRHSIYWIEEQDGSYNPADPTTENGGPLYMLYMAKGSSTPTPMQLSNITDACRILYSGDDPIGKKKYMVVKTAGADSECWTVDDGKVLIHSSMTSSDNPIDMSNRDIISPIVEGLSNPRWAGLLIIEDGVIKKCDPNLLNCTPVSPGSFNEADRVAINPSNGNIYICADGNLHVFDGQTLNTTGVNCAPPRDTTADNSAIYAVDGSGNVRKLTYGGTSWQTIYSGGNARSIDTSTQNYLIVRLDTGVAGVPGGLVAVKKDGSSVTYLTSPGAGAYFPWDVGNKVYFTEIVIDPLTYFVSSIKACEWNEGSSAPTCNNDSYYAGASLATDGTIDTYGSIFPLYRLLKVDGVDVSQGYPSGGTLKAVNPSDGSTIVLGTVPTNFSVSGFGIGDHMLLVGGENPSGRRDIFYVNLSQPNSLQRLTNTPGSDEFLLF